MFCDVWLVLTVSVMLTLMSTVILYFYITILTGNLRIYCIYTFLFLTGNQSYLYKSIIAFIRFYFLYMKHNILT